MQWIDVTVENGRLRPLQPVEWQEGQRLQVQVVPARELSKEEIEALLGDMVQKFDDSGEEDDGLFPELYAMTEDELIAYLDESTRGKGVSLSEEIIAMRREGV